MMLQTNVSMRRLHMKVLLEELFEAELRGELLTGNSMLFFIPCFELTE